MKRQICFWLFFLMAIGYASSISAAAPSYEVYQNEKRLKTFDDKLAAVTYAKKWAHSSVRANNQWIWNNYPYQVYQNDKPLKEIVDYQEAVQFAKKWKNSSVRKLPGDIWVWDNYPYEVYQENQVFAHKQVLAE